MFTQLTKITNLHLETVHAHMNNGNVVMMRMNLNRKIIMKMHHTVMTLIFLEFFENLESSTNASYYPFPSKIFALLYFLVHSPNPVVSFKSEWT